MYPYPDFDTGMYTDSSIDFHMDSYPWMAFYKASDTDLCVELYTDLGKTSFLALQELFKRVIPHQCLGSVWSRRDKNRDRDAASVVATVDQFNAVSFRVISTVLMEPDAKSASRAKVIAKWIDIAQVRTEDWLDLGQQHAVCLND